MATSKPSKGKSPHCADTRAKDGVRGFAGIPKCVLESEAYRKLTLVARAILVEIVGRMDGRNNGSIHISYAEIACRLNRRNQAPIGPAIAELIEHGLLDIAEQSVWQERRAREYRLTFVNTSDSIGRPIKATNEYLQWRPREKNDATDVVAARPKAATPFVAGRITAATDAVPSHIGKLPKPLNGSATDGVIPISKPYAGRRHSERQPVGLLPEITRRHRIGGAVGAHDLSTIQEQGTFPENGPPAPLVGSPRPNKAHRSSA